MHEDLLRSLTSFRVTVQNDRSDKLVLTQTGSGGLNELSGTLSDTRASYGYARVSFSNDKESQREKFVLIVWIGEGTRVMRKAKARFFPWFESRQIVTPVLDIRSFSGC